MTRFQQRAISDKTSGPMRDWRVWAVLAIVLVAIVAIFLLQPIPQSEAYHNFADKRALFGIPNFLNVVSNLLFLLVGALGIYHVLCCPAVCGACRPAATSLSSEVRTSRGATFIDPRERWPYFAFFVGVAITTFGSVYYHFDPRDSTLLWDRIPMAVGFMALVAATVGERISVKASMQILVPLMALGAGSVAYWDVTQEGGHGDLRPYVLVQFGSVLVILLLVGLFPSRYTRGVDLVAALAIYVFAKIFEAADGSIFALGNIVSGHTLKHIAAAVSVYWILRMLRHRDVLPVQQRIRSTNE
jgi:hypothetical protein